MSGCGHGEKSQKLKDCIESWKRCMPDWEIKEWNEDNFDIDFCNFTRQSYDKKQYAFTSDVIRLYALYTEGGYYLDTDVMMYKSLADFENEEGFTGFEDKHYPATATMGAEKGNPVIKLMLDAYKIRDFYTYPVWTDYIKYEETSTCIYSDILASLGIDRESNKLQKIPHFTVYPTSYFFTKGEGYTHHCFNRFVELGADMSIESKNYCIARKCKSCERANTCDLLENLLKERLTYNPFENLKELMEKKYDKTR